MGHLPSLIALRAFEAAARLSSFTRAATELNVSQGAVSHQIRILEAELDAALFYRTGRQVVLTDVGHSLSASLSEAFKIITFAVDAVHAERDPNEVRMIFPPNLSARWLMPRLPRFRKEHPEIVLTLRHANRLEHIEGDTDLAITWSANLPDRSAERLMRLFYAPMCTPKFKRDFGIRSVEQLVDCPLIGSRFCDWSDWFARAGLPRKPVKPRILLDNFNVLINAVLDGQGVGLCPTAFMHDHLAENRLVCLSGVFSTSQEAFYLIRMKRNSNRIAVRKVRQWLLRQAADEIGRAHKSS
jgi:LysR family transcriptional regulator, glycine cleavage system transcriptional activator